MEENKNINAEKAKEIATEGAKLAGKAVKGTAKMAGEAVKAGSKVATAATVTPLLTKVLVVLGVMAGVAGAGAAVKAFFTREPLTIEKTANVVEEVKKIGEFTSAVYYEEVALHDSYDEIATFMGRDASKLASKATRKLGMGFASKFAENTTSALTDRKNEIVLIGKGRVRAGFDLAKLGEGDFNVHGDTLEMVLPPVEVFDIIMNPSDFTTEYEKGTWNHELTKPLKERARLQLEQNALEFGILQKAEESGLKRLETLFQTFGFNTVLLTVSKPSAGHAATEAVVTETANSLPTSTDSTLLSE